MVQQCKEGGFRAKTLSGLLDLSENWYDTGPKDLDPHYGTCWKIKQREEYCGCVFTEEEHSSFTSPNIISD